MSQRDHVLCAEEQRRAVTGQGVTTGPIRILAVDDEPDFEVLPKLRFRRQIRSNECAFRFARHGEETLTADCVTSN